MRLPLTPHGIRELLLFGGACVLVGLVLLRYVHPAAAAVPAVGLLFLFNFFRDPERTPPEGPATAVAPADGKVTDIGEVEEASVGGRALRIGIFLSVFDVHVNRAPLDGTVRAIRYTEGKFHDARAPQSAAENEANLLVFDGPRGPFAVRQIAGLVARRIVCPVRVGDGVARGQRMGMIKFGSRTELIVPADAPVDVACEIGQRVRGGETVLLRYRSP